MNYCTSWREKALDLYDEGKTVYEIKNILYDEIDSPNNDSKLKKVKRLIASYVSTLDEVPQELVEIDTNMKYRGENEIKFAVISDTHIGSKFEQRTNLNAFYDELQKRGIKYVYNAGDICDGSVHMHKGFENEQYARGFEEQAQNVIKNYPHREGIKTYFITGNHDNSFSKDNGADIGHRIGQERKDMFYLGPCECILNLTPKVTMGLYHRGKGVSKGLSLYGQNFVDGMDENDKPTISVFGHIHKTMFMKYKGTNIIYPASFQGRTPFMKSLGLTSEIGGYIVTLKLNDDGSLKSMITEYIGYKEVKENLHI